MRGKRDGKRSRAEYERGLPGYHDYLARATGAPSGLSALTLRLWLAGFGFVSCTVFGILVLYFLPPLAWFGWILLVLAVVALIDFFWVLHRKRRGEPG